MQRILRACIMRDGGMEESDRIICYILKKEMGIKDYPEVDTTKNLTVSKPKEKQGKRGYTLYEQDSRDMSREEIERAPASADPGLQEPKT